MRHESWKDETGSGVEFWEDVPAPSRLVARFYNPGAAARGLAFWKARAIVITSDEFCAEMDRMQDEIDRLKGLVAK